MVEDLLSWLRICFSISFLFFSQTILVYAQGKYSIQHYTNDNGLAVNGVKGIELDKETGFLWIATNAGLMRFDGTHFKSFGKGENKIAASRMIAIGRSKDGLIYCGDDNLSVYRVNDSKPEFVTTDSMFINPYIVWGGRSWIEAVKRMSKELRDYQRFFLFPYWILYHEEPNGNKSFAFNYLERACYYNVTKDTLIYLTQYQDFKQVMRLNGRAYYVRNNLDVWEYNDSLMKFLPIQVIKTTDWHKGGEAPRYVYQPGMETPLLVHNQSIWEVHRKGNTLSFEPLCQECYPSDPHINAIQIWKEQGLIFLSSEDQGVYIVKKPFFHFVPDTASINKKIKAEYAQVEIVAGSITTYSGHSFSFQGKLLSHRKKIEFRNHTIFKDRQGDCWFHSKDTIIRFNPQSSSYTKIALNDGSDRRFFVETNGRLYVISSIAIAEIKDGQYLLKYKIPAIKGVSKHSLHPDAVIEWQPGILAIAAEKLLLFDIEKRIFIDTIAIPGMKSKIRSLLKYKDYYLIGTYGKGFYLYKNGVVKKMPLDKNEYLSYAHCFKVDDMGFCWISTNHGLFKVSFNALVSAYERDLDEVYYQYFGKGDGLINTEFNGGCQPCMLKLSNGEYSFPNMSGLVLFDPHQEYLPPPSGKIFIDEILADSTIYRRNDNALSNLPYDIKNLRFKLSLSYFGNAENIYFSYKLDPHNDDWEQQDITQNNILTFGGLKPGNYKLHLRIRNGFEANQFKITTITFRILPPWYQTWWFYALCVAGLIGLVWGIIKWRTARIEKRKEELQHLVTEQTESIAVQSMQLGQQLTRLQAQQVKLEEDNKIKSRLISIISHDMISPLKFMSYLSKKMMDTIPVADGNRRTAEYIASVSHDMESLTANLLNWIRFHHESLKMEPERFNLYKLIKESSEIAVTLALEKGIRFIIDIPDNSEVIQYRQIIGVIIYNLSMNAVKYTATGEIHIACHLSDEYFSITVKDTGPGMSAETIEKLNDLDSFEFNYATKDNKKYQFGYVIIKDLLRLSNGKMTVKGMPDEGTEVNVQFQMICEHR